MACDPNPKGSDNFLTSWIPMLTQTQTHTPLKDGDRGLLFSNLQETLDYAQVRNLIQAVTLATESMD